MAKNQFVKVEIYLTPENAKILKQVNTIIYTPHLYINNAIETTASMKKFKEMRDEEIKKPDAKVAYSLEKTEDNTL